MAPLTPLGLLFLLFLLELKHFICDGPLQTRAMIAEKAVYGKPMGVVHAVIHGAASVAMLAIAGVSWGLVAGLALADALVHYHIDFAKENIVKSVGWTARDRHFWWALAGDQALHHFTYLAMAAAVVPWP
jgi:hypothetical protein